MVQVLGDNFEFFLQFELVKNRLVMAHELLDYEFFIRARILYNKKSLLMYKFVMFPGSVLLLLNYWMSINATKWTFLVVVLCAAV